jgi:mono/diheme cytochrome c family protein
MEVQSKAVIKGALTLITVSLGIFTIAIFGTVPYPNIKKQPTSAQRNGAAIYAQNCSRCHGTDGRAQTAKGRAVGASDLTSADWLPDTARDIRLVTRGREEMPSFRGKLKPAEIEAVVTYIRRFKR